MSVALARKYRPQDFESVVGQETTVQVLRNALASRRLHHAYLFSGPRGIGKTSIARIFAKALNCGKEDTPTPKPCSECISCREITEGRSLSVMEIDGASNTSVEDVRDLREKIRYLPPGGRYKIYIIDEVHMLSTAAFNALLKTLEEPPPHALFLFATTDPQKVPATVLSRVIRFDLRPISRAAIASQLRKVAQAESITVSDEALFQIARDAEGGLRDALSLLDQVVSYARTGSAKGVTLEAVEEVVGVSTRRFVREMAAAILRREAATLLKTSVAAVEAGVDLKRLTLDLLEYFRHLLVAQVSRDLTLFDLPEEEIAEIASLAREISPPDLDRLFRILQKGVVDLLRSPLPAVLLDVLLLRLTQWESLKPLDEILSSLKGGTPPQEKAPAVDKHSPTWPQFLAFLKNKSPRLAALVEQGRLASLGEAELSLRYPPKSMAVEFLKEPDRASAFSQALEEFFRRPLTVRYEMPDAVAVPGKTPITIVDDAISIFGPTHVTNKKGGA